MSSAVDSSCLGRRTVYVIGNFNMKGFLFFFVFVFFVVLGM